MFKIKRDSKLMKQKLEKNHLAIPSALEMDSNKFKTYIPITNNLEIDLNVMGDTKNLSLWDAYSLILSYEDKFDTIDTNRTFKKHILGITNKEENYESWIGFPVLRRAFRNEILISYSY